MKEALKIIKKGNSIIKNSNTMKILKWLSRDKYLHINSKNINRGRYIDTNLLTYIYSKDGAYIRRYTDMSFGSNFNRVETRNNITRINVRIPKASNIIKLSKYGFMYYSINEIKDNDENLLSRIDIYFFGKDMYKNRKELLDYIKASYNKRHIDRTIDIYNGNRISDTIQIINKKDIIFREIDYLTACISSWYNMKQFYIDKHVTYKFNILLYGKPGCGKTSLIYYICSITDKLLINIDLSSDFKTMKENIEGIESSGHKVIAMEDVDLLMCNEKDNELNQKLQYLLQFLDGASSKEDTITVLTTNYPEKLDSRLLRKGRIDLSLEVKEFNRKEAEMMCGKFQVDPNRVLKDNEDAWNPADLQSRCIETVFKDASDLIKQNKED